MAKILSVIIPTYNMEKYLDYCLSSLIVDNGLETLEVLVINDGSKDSSLDIARRYEAKCPYVFRVIDKENGNYGSCVNRGLKEAQGKYVKILDADDSYDTETFEEYLQFLQNTDADLVVSNFYIVNEEREITKCVDYDLPNDKVCTFDEVGGLKAFDDMEMHAVTYKRNIFDGMNYHQTEGISYTDQQWIFEPITGVTSVAHFPKHVYKYLVGRQGQTMAPAVMARSRAHLQKCCLDMADSLQLRESHLTPSHIDYLNRGITRMAKSIYIESLKVIDSDNKNALIAFDNNLREANPVFYGRLADSCGRFSYIHFWRRHQNWPCVLFRLVMNIALSLKTKTKIFNVNG